MGFFENWLGDKVNAALGRTVAALQPPSGMPPLQPAGAGAGAGVAALPAAADGLAASLRARIGRHLAGEPVIRDYTTKPSIDPALLQKILPRDGQCELTVSGLDGVLTIGKDMVMTTDQPIHCQTLRVLGTLEATVYAQKLIVAEGARVTGSVRVNDADIRGEFDGSLQARGEAVIHSTAAVFGKVRALEVSIAKDALVHGADIKRVVPRVLDDLTVEPINDGRFDDGYSSMCITVSQRSALRR